jgi:hypothetical protein
MYFEVFYWLFGEKALDDGILLHVGVEKSTYPSGIIVSDHEEQVHIGRRHDDELQEDVDFHSDQQNISFHTGKIDAVTVRIDVYIDAFVNDEVWRVRHPNPFDIWIAVKRWIDGAITGVRRIGFHFCIVGITHFQERRIFVVIGKIAFEPVSTS